MRDVKMGRDELMVVVKRNRDAHVEVFERAYDEYERRVKAEFERVVAELRDTPVSEVDINAPGRLPRPVNHVEDYDTALAMLDDDTRDRVLLTRAEYEQYVQDDWGWKQSFTATTAAYTAG